jgi:tetratricopeptide (TPR) repeat protein
MFSGDNKKKGEQYFSALTKEALEKIRKNLSNTLWLGLAAGAIGIIGYTLSLPQGGWKLLFLSILLASAAYISGFFLGFLFGIPKRNTDAESAYNLSTNLVDISDWLTKIIIGLGLIEIKRLPGYLQSIGVYIQNSTGGEDSIKVYSVCCIVYFSIFGLYYGYNYMRLFLSGQFKEADDNLLQNRAKLSERGDVLNKQNLSPDSIDKSAIKTVSEYNELLKSTKTEEDYTFEDWYYKGIEAYDKKEYNKTIAFMRSAIEKDTRAKNAPDAYLYIGLSYNYLGLFDKAIDANNKIISDYKDYPFLYLAYHNNGSYNDSLGYTEKAVEAYEMALHLQPNYANSLNDMAYVLIKLKRYDDAMVALDKAIKLDSAMANAWYNKANIFAILNEKEDMLTNLRRAIDLDPGNKNMARTDKYFESFREDEDFKKLLQ